MRKTGSNLWQLFHLLILILIIFAFPCCQPPSPHHTITEPVKLSPEDIVTLRDIPEGHKAFIARFLPAIYRANNNILKERNRLYQLRDSLDEQGVLRNKQIHHFNQLMSKYRLDCLSTEPPPQIDSITRCFDRLLRRADIIPPRLVLAQAIIESGWGSSGFALEGNNYFGIRCYREGCGVKPAGVDSASFFVKVYDNEMASIEDYLRTLNTGYVYRGLREAREEMRIEKQLIDPFKLIPELNKYSEKREEYISMLSNIVRNYTPENTSELVNGDR